jgi:hypothetical protein
MVLFGMKFKKNEIIKVPTPKVRKKPIKQGSVMDPPKGGSYKRIKRVNPDD